MSATSAVLQLLAACGAVYDLSQPIYPAMPHWPNNPPYTFALSRMHGDRILGDGVSSAIETFHGTAHMGTHMDAFGHFSHHYTVHGVGDIRAAQDPDQGLRYGSIESAPIQPRRGVLLDVARAVGTSPLPRRFGIGARELEMTAEMHGVTVQAGDAVLIRTGWGSQWTTGNPFPTADAPGIALDGAQWLRRQQAAIVGTDTLSFEQMPNDGWPVHVELLVRGGIYIVESLNLEGLSTDGISEFVWIGVPLPLRGATGSPLRPIAVVPAQPVPARHNGAQGEA